MAGDKHPFSRDRDKQMRLSFPILVMVLKIIPHVTATRCGLPLAFVCFVSKKSRQNLKSNLKLFLTLRNNCNIIFTSHRINIFGRNLGKALYSSSSFVCKGLSLCYSLQHSAIITFFRMPVYSIVEYYGNKTRQGCGKLLDTSLIHVL